ncbi:MAG: HEPN domain-containing protein [Candidatus Bathyarchaeota archaeon]|nr:HEPN domain-containing protein [Candidatus Bathyarchaeota archaeon]
MKLDDIVKNKLKEIVANHCVQGGSMTAPFVGERSGYTISMDDEALRLLSETIRKIMTFRPKIKEKFTDNYLQDRLIDIIFSCHIAPPSDLDIKLQQETRRLLRRLHRTIESWVFLIPIVNLKMIGLKKISIGEVDFYDLNPKTFKYLELEFGTKMGHEKTLAKRRSVLTRDNIHVISVTKATAGETEKAKNLALYKVDSSLNVLRLYNFVNDVGIQRGFSTSFSRENIYFQNLRTGTIGATHGGLPPPSFFPFSITKSALKQMRRFQFRNFSKLLRGKWPTKLAEKLAMAIHWYGLAVKDKYGVDKIIKLTVALESLLLRREDRLKKQLLAERAAFILGKDGKSRKEIFEIVEELYTLRSDIVHEGKHDISEEDTLRLLELVRILIHAMMKISLRVTSLKDIDKRIKEIKFGSHIRGV